MAFSREERLDQLAALLELDLPLTICADRMGYSSRAVVCPLFKEMERRTFGPNGLTRAERRELRTPQQEGPR